MIGRFWGEFVPREPQLNADNMGLLFSWLHERNIQPLIFKCYPLAQAPAALDALLTCEAIDKLVILPQKY